MGFNTTVVVLNDALHEIRDDKEFGAKLYDAVITVGRSGQDGWVGSYALDTSNPDHVKTLIRTLADRLGYTVALKRKSVRK